MNFNDDLVARSQLALIWLLRMWNWMTEWWNWAGKPIFFSITSLETVLNHNLLFLISLIFLLLNLITSQDISYNLIMIPTYNYDSCFLGIFVCLFRYFYVGKCLFISLYSFLSLLPLFLYLLSLSLYNCEMNELIQLTAFGISHDIIHAKGMGYWENNAYDCLNRSSSLLTSFWKYWKYWRKKSPLARFKPGYLAYTNDHRGTHGY